MNRSFITLIFAGLILMPASSCKKGKRNFVLTGIISDDTFSSGLDGAHVQLYAITAGGGSTYLVDETIIGTEGRYHFTFPRDQVETYILTAEKDNYFSIEENVPFSDLTIEEDNVRNFSTTAKSWVRLRFKNSNPQPTDELIYIRQSGKTGCDLCCSGSEQSLFGAVDTSIYCINDGNTEYSYYYWVANSANQGARSVSTTAFDTVEIYLNY